MWISLGYATVTTAGTLVRATQNATLPAARIAAHSILFQQKSTNTGKIYICQAGADKSTGSGVLAVLSIPTTNLLPSVAVTVTYAPNGFNVADFWLDADVSNESCLVSYVQA